MSGFQKFYLKQLLYFIILLLLISCNPTHPTTLIPATEMRFTQTLPATPLPTQSSDDLMTLGYYTGSQESFDSFREYSSYLDIVSVDVFGFYSDGTIVGMDEHNISAEPNIKGISYYACISNWNSDPEVGDFDPELAHAALVTYKEKMITQLVDLANTAGYTGINIDFENIAYTDDLNESRIVFSDFIHELADKLHKNGKKLIISVAAKESDDPNNDWSYPYDLAALGKDADYLQVMTYDQHGTWGGPGSISGADWFEEVARYSSSVVDPSKLLIGLPAYGYDWNLSKPNVEADTFLTTSFSWKNVPLLVAKPGAQTIWDESSQSPSVTYSENGNDHVAWFENPRSIQAKMRLVSKYHLGGISVWALGMEDLQFWQSTVIVEE